MSARDGGRIAVLAGGHAELDGVVHSTTSLLSGPLIQLLVHRDAEAPGGFERRVDGTWMRVVERTSLTRLFRVTTHATWRGHEVRVERVLGHEAHLWSQTYRPPDDSRVVLDRDSWSATVPVDELSDVVSTTEELPVTWPVRPEGLAW